MRMFFPLALAALCCAPALTACDSREGETVESAYVLPPYPDPSYAFKRNGTSSVDYLECNLLSEPLDHIYESYLRGANVMYAANRQRVQQYFDEGEFGLAPRKAIAASALHRNDSAKVLRDLEELFSATARLSGLGQPSPSVTRNRRATMGTSGFVGAHIGDVNVAFADERGVVVAELFPEMVRGALYLDQVLNTHLDEGLLNDTTLRNAHENGVLLPGRNYTALEHHWDLAYGYYQFWQPYAETAALPVLRGTRIVLYNAFARGRQALTEYRYEDAREALRIIRSELSKVVAVHAMYLLAGERTTANLEEDVQNALPFVSQALGAVYALQFTRRADGQPHFTYDETAQLLAQLTAGNGLWDKQRLLGDENTPGSLRATAKSIGQRYGLRIEDVVRRK